jgi:error-prone DNA polymerase
MASIPRNAPTRFYDLVIQVAIIRPGPIVGGMVHPYFERRRGRQKVTYPHPSLEPILKRTLGVLLFQEQILRVAMVAAGFTGGEAEDLRRAMGFKRSAERMQKIDEKLRRGMSARGITGKAQEEIVQAITSFALYGFPESHAASFALIAYSSAYLKAHHPTAFVIALLNAWPMGFYHPATLVKDAQRHGVEVRPIDVNFSGCRCRWEENASESGNAPKSPGSRPAEQAPAVQDTSPLEHHPLSYGGENSSDSRPQTLAAAIQGVCLEPRDPIPPDEVHALRDTQPKLRLNAADEVAHAARGAVRMGLRYIKGLRHESGEAIEQERALRPFENIDDLVQRCRLRREELDNLAEAGALASLGLTRRAALWQVAKASKPAGPLYEKPLARAMTAEKVTQGLVPRPAEQAPAVRDPSPHQPSSQVATTDTAVQDLGFEPRKFLPPGKAQVLKNSSLEENSPLPEMTPFQETLADYSGTGLTTGPHPMEHLRSDLNRHRIIPAAHLERIPHGERVRTAGSVIVRQRPGTAKGILFLTLEDETGMSQAIIGPDLLQKYRRLVVGTPGLVVEGVLQKRDGTFSVKAEKFWKLTDLAATPSHDFH